MADETSASSLAMPPPTDLENSLAVMGSRPLLAEGRRPHSASPPSTVEALPEPEPVVPDIAPAVPPTPPVLRMLGTLEKDGLRSVLLRDESTASENWYRTGDVILGWTIVEILPDGVRLQLQGAEIAFNLFQE